MAANPDCHRALKRRKLEHQDDSVTESESEEAPAIQQQSLIQIGSETESEDENEAPNRASAGPLRSLHRAITPPSNDNFPADTAAVDDEERFPLKMHHTASPDRRDLPSPFKLTRIKDLPSASNVDTVSLSDILKDPLIKECWQFNFLFDIDFIMNHLDEDAKHIVQVKIVHGSWKKEDANRVMLEEAAKRYDNVQLITAYMPEPFGTHHSKMMILIRHDDTAQVLIHTANMITQDWGNMCQAVWSSPLLPLHCEESGKGKTHPMGSGERFKADLLHYLKFYGKRLAGLPEQLVEYDFSTVRAAFIASTPCRQDPKTSNSSTAFWGWLGLRQIIRQIPTRTRPGETPNINIQISSVATLGRTDDWLRNLFNAMSNSLAPVDVKDGPSGGASQPASHERKPKFRVIFPTADTVRRSLDGYASGGSIHWKLQSAAQQAQLAYLKPYLHHWAGDSASDPTASEGTSQHERQRQDKMQTTVSGLLKPREAGRRRAAPHIKTYIRFSDSSQKTIDWAMLTSANLSTQAWGSLPGKKDGEVRTSSWETGVIVWPDLVTKDLSTYKERQKAIMVPTFGHDIPSGEQLKLMKKTMGADIVVGLRMPYDLPLIPYAGDDEPWCATAEYEEPDWKGISWM